MSDWWRSAVIYQIYIRSFADGNGDGVGDIAGIRSRLPYIAALQLDAIWITPWYPSPMKDGGYDVSDFRDIDPLFGTLAEADAMIAEAHVLGLRVLLDVVPNHVSDRHVWFQEALSAGPDSSQRARFIFRPGRGPGGELAPNDWQSNFGGPAWTRATAADGRPEEWYLHMFTPQQPDLNWSNAEVRAEFEDVLRFWFHRGVDGFRIDVAHGLAKAPGLPDAAAAVVPAGSRTARHPAWDRDEVHEIYREWRALADSYDEPRAFVAEAWVDDPERLVRYVRADELHTAFNFDFLVSPWRAEQLRATITETLRHHEEVGAPATWVLSNHDVIRDVSRFARPQSVRELRHLRDAIDLPADLARGRRRARAAALLMLALPGSAYVYQGEELGLEEVEDLPAEALHDPAWEQSGHTDRGRDGCRVPLPWSGEKPPFGFGPEGGAPPWLPQPAAWRSLTAQAQSGVPGSMLELYRAALRIRRGHPALGEGRMQWLDGRDGTLAFAREPGFVCVVNLSEEPAALPCETEPLLHSWPLTAECHVPVDTAVWLTR